MIIKGKKIISFKNMLNCTPVLYLVPSLKPTVDHHHSYSKFSRKNIYFWRNPPKKIFFQEKKDYRLG